jgi:hypothetical protein
MFVSTTIECGIADLDVVGPLGLARGLGVPDRHAVARDPETRHLVGVRR